AVALTRDGDLHVDATHKLASGDGATLDPPISVPEDVEPTDIRIAPDGTVSTATGRTLGKLTLVAVPAPDGLAGLSGGLFAATAPSGAATPARDTVLQQGFLEQSNVDLAGALTEMLDAQRDFQMASRVIHTQDQLLEIANGIRR